MVMVNSLLVQVLKDALAREYEKIRAAEAEVHKLELDLLDLGFDLEIGG